MACGCSFRCWRCTTALTAGFVFLIARRLRLPIPYAIGSGDPAVPALTVFLRCLHARRLSCASTGDVLRGGMPGGRSRAGTSNRTQAAPCSSGCCWSPSFSRGRSGSDRRCSCLSRSHSRPDRAARDRLRDLAIGLAPLFVVAVDPCDRTLGMAGDRSNERRRARAGRSTSLGWAIAVAGACRAASRACAIDARGSPSSFCW